MAKFKGGTSTGIARSECNLIRDSAGNVTHRVCSNCKLVIAIDRFCRDNKSKAGGYQRTCKSCNALYVKKHRALGLVSKETAQERYERIKKYRKDNPLQTKAHAAVGRAIRKGILIRQPCHCGKRGEAHHVDYNKPLEVTWLCRQHHSELHKSKNETAIPFMDWKFWGRQLPKKQIVLNPDEINHPNYKCDLATADLIRERAALGSRQKDLAVEFGMSKQTVSKIVRQHTYKRQSMATACAETSFNPKEFGDGDI